MKTSHADFEVALTVRDRTTGGSITYTTTPEILQALANHTGPDNKPILVARSYYDPFDHNHTHPTTYWVSQHHRKDGQ